MKSLLAFSLFSIGAVVSSFGQELPPPFPEVGKTYFVRYAPGMDSTFSRIKVLRVEPNGWILADVPANKACWINPQFIAVASLIEETAK